MSITVQQISRRAKATRKPGEKWIHAIKRASKELKSGHKVSAVKYIEKGETKRTKAKKVYKVKRNKKGNFEAFNQVGSIASHKAAIRGKVKDRLAKQLLRREMATKKSDRRKISKSIRQTKNELNRYC